MTPTPTSDEKRVNGRAHDSVRRRLVRIERQVSAVVSTEPDLDVRIEEVEARLTIVEQRLDTLHGYGEVEQLLGAERA